jgi:hypothetical protein
MLSEPLEPLLQRRRIDDAGAPRAIATAEAVSMMPEPLSRCCGGGDGVDDVKAP